MDYNPPGSSVPGILQARILNNYLLNFKRRKNLKYEWSYNLAATNWFLGILNGLIVGLDTIAIGAIYKYKHREMQR